jgi:hypothetical protein
MPQYFKALATVIAWILFLGGCFGLISRTIVWFANTGFTGTGEEMARLALQYVFIAIWFIGAVVVIKLRKTLD